MSAPPPPCLESRGQEEKPENLMQREASRHLWPFPGCLSRPSVYPSAAAADTRC